MNSTALWTHAWNAALPVWADVVRGAGWHPVLVAAAYAAAGLLCLAVAQPGRSVESESATWTVAAAALLILALNTLLAVDVLLLQCVRGVAHERGWYGVRRGAQAGALAAATLTVVVAGAWLRSRWVRHGAARRWLLAGLAVLLGLAALRAVSLHATDELINHRLAGLSVGRLLDALGLGLVAIAALQALRTGRT